jgi:hypothetical protein
MRRLLTIAAVAALATAVFAAPAAATTTPIAIHCDETRITDWTIDREWVDENLVYHARGETAVYRDLGSPYCQGYNYATVNVNLDLLTGEGMVIVFAHRELDAFVGGWDAKLVAHFTPLGEYIWVGEVVGHGYGDLAGYQIRSTVVEPTHETAIEDGFVFLPGQ